MNTKTSICVIESCRTACQFLRVILPAIVCFSASSATYAENHAVPNRLTREKMERVRLGMTKAQVVGVLGRPSMDLENPIDTKEIKALRPSSMVYGEPGSMGTVQLFQDSVVGTSWNKEVLLKASREDIKQAIETPSVLKPETTPVITKQEIPATPGPVNENHKSTQSSAERAKKLIQALADKSNKGEDAKAMTVEKAEAVQESPTPLPEDPVLITVEPSTASPAPPTKKAFPIRRTPSGSKSPAK